MILFIALTLLLQQPVGLVPCFDRCGNLSADDQRQIAREAATEGTPWLAARRPDQFRVAGVANVRRRVTGQSGRYAQMVSPDRDADDVRGRTDANRPFVVVGTFTDEELISLVQFVRTSPRAGGDSSERVQGQFGITDVRRVPGPDDPTSVNVVLQLTTGQYQKVALTRTERTWIVTHTNRFEI